MWFYYRNICPKATDGIRSSLDHDQSAPSGLIWVYTVCPDLSVQDHYSILITGILDYNPHTIMNHLVRLSVRLHM